MLKYVSYSGVLFCFYTVFSKWEQLFTTAKINSAVIPGINIELHNTSSPSWLYFWIFFYLILSLLFFVFLVKKKEKGQMILLIIVLLSSITMQISDNSQSDIFLSDEIIGGEMIEAHH